MKSICYIIPYFGVLPKNFSLWLLGCKMNPTVNWIVLTDDHTSYDYPPNVLAISVEYEIIKERIRKNYNFDVLIDRPWRLALFKPAYGEIFKEELAGYDFWGYCDVDLMWGDIRKFYTDTVLDSYERIGFLGHSCLYCNTEEINSRYRIIVPGEINYIDVFSGESGYSFDENGMDAIYKYLGISYFQDIVLIDLEKYEAGFFCNHFPISEKKKNRYQIFTWENGHIFRHYLWNNKIIREEYLYIHFFCRPMKYSVSTVSQSTIYYIYPDVMTDEPLPINMKTLKRYGTRSKIAFVINSMWVNRRKINGRRIKNNICNLINYIKKSNGYCRS